MTDVDNVHNVETAFGSPETLSSVKGILEVGDCIDSAISLVGGYINFETIEFPPRADVELGIIADVGSLIQRGIPSIIDEVATKLEELRAKLEFLEKTTDTYLAALEKFIAKFNFPLEIINILLSMKRFLKDCLSSPDIESINNFRDTYNQNSPINLFYALLSILQTKSTNPFEGIRKDSTEGELERLEKAVHIVIGELMFFEAFASGLLKNRNSYNFERMNEQCYVVFKEIYKWRKELEKKNRKYWDEFKNGFEDYIKSNVTLSNSQKADAIKKKLESYYSDYQFYIVVSDKCEMNKNLTIYCSKMHTQMAYSWDNGHCTAFVYQSRTAYEKLVADYEKIKNDMESCRYGKLNKESGSLDNIIKKQLVDKNIVPDYGFIALIDASKNVEIRSANCPRQYGPGWWITPDVKDDNGKVVHYRLIGSFD